MSGPAQNAHEQAPTIPPEGSVPPTLPPEGFEPPPLPPKDSVPPTLPPEGSVPPVDEHSIQVRAIDGGYIQTISTADETPPALPFKRSRAGSMSVRKGPADDDAEA